MLPLTAVCCFVAGRKPILSSTPLQILFHLNCWYFAAFFLAEVLMFVYKGSKGNLCERCLATSVSVLILLPCVALAVYYLYLQTFVLRMEFILSSILLCFYGLEFLLGLVSIFAFSRSKVY
ncbi:transmembrane protein 216 isoform X3 [Lampris incognitus]|uniref:transmembrane protein 216 isoform X3 n=1 Tax=Lampris incognitus TaxID=2546036 RepID=UPI0024B6049A|nr:transmembrane protein 216 isoform X3 [Lampris incognitus]